MAYPPTRLLQERSFLVKVFGCQGAQAPTGIKLLPAPARIRSELGKYAVHGGQLLAPKRGGQLIQQRLLFGGEILSALSVPIGNPDAAAVATAYRFKRIGGRELFNITPYRALIDAELRRQIFDGIFPSLEQRLQQQLPALIWPHVLTSFRFVG